MPTAPQPPPGSPGLGHVLPFAVFAVLTAVEGWGPLEPHYPWVYTVKIALVAATWWVLRGHYPAPRRGGLLLGVLAGVVGLFVWVGICGLGLEQRLPAVVRGALGMSGSRAAYNPFEVLSPGAAWSFLVVRFAGLALIVPLFEEVFWRGFLMRLLVDEEFTDVPLGRYTHLSFFAVTLAFAAVHPQEVVAAIVWGAMINGLLVWTKNLWACIVCHAVTNLLLGVYILRTGAWQLW